MGYADFVKSKFRNAPHAGIGAEPLDYGMFPHQKDLVRFALRRGRAAVFADTGLGKMVIELAWADTIHRHTGRDVLILTPLAVAQQMVAEGERIGVNVAHVRNDSEIRSGVNVLNYERLHLIDHERFIGVAMDESSRIKHHASKTLQALMDAFECTPYKLCGTATPAPNDWTELGTHAEFLGVRSRAEMLAEFFVHDGGDTQTWRLKGHARRDFWRWVANWGALVRSPADIGHDASTYVLPPLHVHQHTVQSDHNPAYGLFAVEAQTLSDRRDARRASLVERVRACAQMVNADKEPWIVWCDLNAEGDALRAAIPDAVEVRGADDTETKEQRLIDFSAGRIRVLITKPSIAGWGLNWQHCARVAFVGVTDSWEAYYQAVRRCWRFGQAREVHAHIFASEREGAVVANLQRKEREARAMAEALSDETLHAVRAEIIGAKRETNDYRPTSPIHIPSFIGAAA